VECVDRKRHGAAPRTRTHAEKSDDELILLVQGVTASYDSLVNAIRGGSTISRSGWPGPRRADDLAQETFVKAYFAIGSFEWGGVSIRGSTDLYEP